MTLTEATRSAFRNYFRYSGRASRSEFWKFVLFMLLGGVLALILNSLIFGPEIVTNLVSITQEDGSQTTQTVTSRFYSDGWIGDFFFLACLVPFFAVGWRRMHDTGLAGWWFIAPIALLIAVAIVTVVASLGLTGAWEEIQRTGQARVQLNGLLGLIFALIAFAPQILLLLRLCRRSDPGPNKYGPNPLEVTP